MSIYSLDVPSKIDLVLVDTSTGRNKNGLPMCCSFAVPIS